MPARSAKRPPPKQWLFNEEDRTRHAGRYWRCPVRLVKDSNRLWAQLWREDGTVRGGGAVTSILPILTYHAWPDMKGAEPGWTGWASLSQRRLARLAGLNKDTVGQAFNRLATLGLMQTRREAREKYLGGYRTWYRLSASLYPTDRDDPYAEIQSSLFYGGVWGLLPTSAARHLYVVLACLDPVGNETAYLQSILEDTHTDTGPWWDLYFDNPLRYLEFDESNGRYDNEDLEPKLRIDYLAAYRARHPASLTELAVYSGLTRATVSAALQVLTTPIVGGQQRPDSTRRYQHLALVLKGAAAARMPTWYVPDRRGSWVDLWARLAQRPRKVRWPAAGTVAGTVPPGRKAGERPLPSRT